jgi:ABC-type uncharacterized transport system substrate-binding protein
LKEIKGLFWFCKPVLAARRAFPEARVVPVAAIAAIRRTGFTELSHVNVRDATEIERSIISFARFSNGGLIITAGGLPYIHLNLIVKLAAQHRLPAVYFERAFAAAGGLMSYGPDLVDQFRRAAGYVDRILKGEKPADLPVQAPTKYELVTPPSSKVRGTGSFPT